MTADVYDSNTRSRVMRAVKSGDTGPERTVRSLLHANGYRFRIRGNGLPGTPDIVFPARRAVVFVHGCFWHGHDCPRAQRAPRANAAYWADKRLRTVHRDHGAILALEALGWKALVVWECELKDAAQVVERLKRFLGPPKR